MKKASSILIVLGVCALSACNSEEKGTLNVERAFVANKSYSSQTDKVTIPEGRYALTVSSGSITTEFTLKDSGNKSYEFRTPVVDSLTRDDGIVAQRDLGRAVRTTVQAADLNQNFDASVNVTTIEKNRGDSKSGTRSCYNNCGTAEGETCTGGGCDPDPNGGCIPEPVSCTPYEYEITGKQNYSGYKATIQRTFDFSFVDAGGRDLAQGQVIEPQRDGFVDLETSPCVCPN